MEVTLEERSSFGNARIYIVGTGAEELTRLLRRRTIDRADVALLERLGVTVRWVAPSWTRT